MSGYDTFKSSFLRKRSPSHTSSQLEEETPPHLYATPAVSRGLITAFGRPTLIEYEVPDIGLGGTGTGGILGRSSEPGGPTHHRGESSEFQPVHRTQRTRSTSLPASELAHIETKGSIGTLGGTGRHQRAHTQTSGYGTHSAHRRNRSGTFDDASFLTTAYTYRVKSLDANTHDEHHLVMCQNPDGTYCHANAEGELVEPVEQAEPLEVDGMEPMEIAASTDAGAPRPDEEDNLMASSTDLTASISLDTITRFSQTLSHLTPDGPGVNPPIPPEMLHPSYTQTAPALKLWPLAVLVFYNVSGGPFGIEPSIRSGGNFFAILGFIVFPLIWSVPEALITAELGSAFQHPSAGVAWVEEAFGDFAGKMCGYLSWLAGATDNAIYPTLFMEYVSSTLGWKETDEQGEGGFGGRERFMYVAAITISLSLLNYRGLEIVGNASLLVCIIAMSPFVILTVIGAPKVQPSRWFQMPEVNGEDFFDDDFQVAPGPVPLFGLWGIVWRPYLNNMFWNLNSFDNAASFSGETTCVRTTYPRGIFIGLAMCTILYILPIMVAVGATDYKQSEWVDGHLGAVAVDIGGNWLGAWIIFAAGISNLALFEAELSSDAFQLMGMAEKGYLPKIFQKRSKYGTPTTGIIVGTFVILAFGCADFGRLLELLNANYAISLLMEYAAFVKLRWERPDMERPYRIPIPDWAAIFVVIPPVLGILVIFALSNWAVYFFCIGTLAFGVSLFKMGEICKDKGWFTFETKMRGAHQYAMSPMEEGSERESSGGDEDVNGNDTSNGNVNKRDSFQENGYKNEELDVIQEENRVV